MIAGHQQQAFHNSLTAKQRHQLDRMEAAMGMLDYPMLFKYFTDTLTGFNESDDEYIPHLCSPRSNRNLSRQEPEAKGTNDDKFAVSLSSPQAEPPRPRLDKQFLMERIEVRRNRSSDFTNTLAAPMESFTSFNDFTTYGSGGYDATSNAHVQATTRYVDVPFSGL